MFVLGSTAFIHGALAAGAKPAAAAPAPKPLAAPAPAAESKPAPEAAGSADAAVKPTSDEAFDVRVKGLEEQVNDIKEKIFRTKARLLLLQETVVGGDIVSGAKAIILHKNEMGSSFRLTSVAYALDGSPIFTKVDVNGDLADKDSIEIFNGRIVPGTHQLTVRLEYKGHGFGPISYLDGYSFRVSSSYTFNAEGGKATTVQAIGYEKGGPFAELKDKPDVKYETQVQKSAEITKSSDPGAAQVRPTSAPAP
jgi:hypothetical protein